MVVIRHCGGFIKWWVGLLKTNKINSTCLDFRFTVIELVLG